MSRLRASLAKSDADQKLQKHLYDAELDLLEALRTCEALIRAQGGRHTDEATRRAAAVSQKIQRLLAGLQDVGHLLPPPEIEPEVKPVVKQRKVAKLNG